MLLPSSCSTDVYHPMKYLHCMCTLMMSTWITVTVLL